MTDGWAGSILGMNVLNAVGGKSLTSSARDSGGRDSQVSKVNISSYAVLFQPTAPKLLKEKGPITLTLRSIRVSLLFGFVMTLSISISSRSPFAPDALAGEDSTG